MNKPSYYCMPIVTTVHIYKRVETTLDFFYTNFGMPQRRSFLFGLVMSVMVPEAGDLVASNSSDHR